MDLVEVGEIVPAQRPGAEDWRAGDGWLAGGTWLFSEPQPQLRRLLDLTAFGWPPLISSQDGLEIAATCTLAELAGWPGESRWPASPLVRQCCDALLGSFKVWNAATVGGNVCLALPAGPMTSLASSLDGTCTVWEPGGGVRSLSVAEFVTGPRRTALAPGELLRSVTLPADALRAHTAFRQFSLTPLGRSAAVVIGRLSPEVNGAVITITAAVPRPVQLRFDALPSAVELRDAIAARELTYHDDVHGLPEWRAHLTGLLAEQVRAELADRVG